MRKATLVTDLKIDTESFKLQLINSKHAVVSADRLSAGERQLLAISLLWGLARASGRPLPIIIDTPLSRLDSIHRNKLVTNYFPYASHQVLIFSTDEEIDSELFKELYPFIGHSFHLHYNEQSGSSEIQDGYFW